MRARPHPPRPAWRVAALVLLLAACGVNEVPPTGPAPAEALTEQEVEDLVLNEAVDLAPGSTLDGSPLVTQDDLDDLSWSDLDGVPADLLDGDDDTLAGLACAEGEWPSQVGGAWACTAALPPERVDAASAVEGDVLMATAAGAAWVDPATALGAGTCPAAGMTVVGDNCVETATRPTARWMDAVVACADAGLHLCFHSEIAPGCLSGALTPAPGSSGLEWAADRTGNGQAATAFGPLYDCEATADSIGNTRAFRCCTPAR